MHVFPSVTVAFGYARIGSTDGPIGPLRIGSFGRGRHGSAALLVAVDVFAAAERYADAPSRGAGDVDLYHAEAARIATGLQVCMTPPVPSVRERALSDEGHFQLALLRCRSGWSEHCRAIGPRRY